MKNQVQLKKFLLQDLEYVFPYHYIPYFDKKGTPKRIRDLSWGLEYLCYISHIELIVKEYSPQSMIDIGCGSGRFTGLFKNSISRIVGVDLSNSAIRFAKAFHEGIEFYCTNAEQIHDEFDIVTAIEVLEHIPDEYLKTFFTTLNNRCKQGGHIIICVPTTNTPVIEKHYRHYNIELFNEELINSRTNLEIVRVEYIYKKSILSKIYRRIFCNKYWNFEVNILQKYIWNFVWKKNRYANSSNGKHMVVILKKYDGNEGPGS